MTSFEHAAYLEQVRRLRDLAARALVRYPIRVKTYTLIDHWENTTFRVTTTSGSTYMLRVHRHGYHREPAVLEEMEWLDRLSKDSELKTPMPIRSRDGGLVETVTSSLVPEPRFCCLFQWIHGRFIQNSLNASHVNMLGTVTAKLHHHTEGVTVTHRRYWDAEGLIGAKPKFGSIDALEGISSKAQDTLTRGRELVLRRLQRFEKAFSQKSGLIHADLHFSNVLLTGNELGIIDFDDCGFGFHIYDLAVSLFATEYLLSRNKQLRDLPRMKTALIEGYARERGWGKEDDTILPYYLTARRLLLLGWINSRFDHPKLKSKVKKMANQTVSHLKKEYGLP